MGAEKKKLTRRVEYNFLSSFNPIAVHKLKPRPPTPLCGRGMVSSPLGLAVAALRNASFSAGRINEVS